MKGFSRQLAERRSEVCSLGEGIWCNVVEKNCGGKRKRSCRSVMVMASADEAGSSLILALVFLIIGSLIVTALAGWSITDLRNSNHFSANRSVLYAADSDAQLVMWILRYNYSIQAGGLCQLSNGTPIGELSLNGVSVSADCVTSSTGTGRLATISVFQPTDSVPILSAVVAYNDVAPPYKGQLPPVPAIQCTSSLNSSCGVSMMIVSWKVL